MSRRPVWALVIGAIVLLPCLLIVGPLTVDYFYTKGRVKWEESHDLEFNLESWNAGSRANIYSATALKIDAPRIKMCRDFIANQPWQGKTREELEAWLGKPDNFPYVENGWDFNYWVGLQRGPLKLDSAWLCFQFDSSGKATQASLKQD